MVNSGGYIFWREGPEECRQRVIVILNKDSF